MLFNCDVCVVGLGEKGRWSKAKVGLGTLKEAVYIMVITSSSKLKFNTINISQLYSSSIMFSRPEKTLMIKNVDHFTLKTFFTYLKSVKKGKKVSFLPSIDDYEKLKLKPSALDIVGTNYNLNDLRNHSLLKLFFQGTHLIPKCTWNLKNLTHLSLVDCNLEKVPEKLVQLENLKILCLAKNKINRLDSKIFLHLVHLLSFDVSYNQLCFIPLEIAALKSLTTINFNHNQIKQLPFSLGFLPKLKEVNVAENLINSFSLPLLILITTKLSLIKLDLSGNPFVCPKVSSKVVKVPDLILLASRIVLSRLKLIRVMHEWIPQDLYKYIQRNAQLCSLCHQPFVGHYFLKNFSAYNLTKLASTVISDQHLNSQIHPVIFLCDFCSKNGQSFSS